MGVFEVVPMTTARRSAVAMVRRCMGRQEVNASTLVLGVWHQGVTRVVRACDRW